ncbi:PKD domain-containing protein [Flavivirga rizhaonensis]|uniref:PKD domain-containing protein n=1 Tax=Flavivirga rizhaonensis TaxID=2559571 RepID=A0A4S1DWJ8_9FLAO|nr:PKD domain-containing protein [Flavivirga rizhaonensis]TGV01852.1 PKD domain-containing protein [Flavivirga rizhaonensis]
MKLYKTKYKGILSMTIMSLLLILSISCESESDSFFSREITFKPSAKPRVTTEGNQITFIDSSTSVTSRLWTFEGASIVNSDQQEVAVTYPNYGTYPVDIQVTDNAGKTFDRRFNVQIWKQVTAAFSPDKTTAKFGSTINFINLSESLNQNLEDQDFDRFEWIFEGGDPVTSTVEEPSVVYTNVGKFDVTLKVVRSFPPDSMTITMPDLINIVDVDVINPVASKLSSVGKEIHLTYDKDVAAFDASAKDSFTLTVDGQDYEISAAALAAGDATKIILTLENSIKEGDANIKLNYNGNLLSDDGSAILGGISGLPITNNLINLFGTRDGVAYSGFENDDAGVFPAGWGAWNGTANRDDYVVVDTESASGDKSLEIRLFNDVGFEGWGVEAKGWSTADDVLPDGKYQVQVWAKSTIAGKRLTIGTLADGWAQADVGNVFLTTEWALYTFDFEVVDALPRYYYQQLRATEDYTVWVDDIKLYNAD